MLAAVASTTSTLRFNSGTRWPILQVSREIGQGDLPYPLSARTGTSAFRSCSAVGCSDGTRSAGLALAREPDQQDAYDHCIPSRCGP